MKYTVPSSKTAKGTAATRKFGFFESEADVVAWIREKTGLAEGQRHPLTWLMEACDDSLLLRVWRNLDDIPPDIDAKVKKAQLSTASIPLAKAGAGAPFIRMNALPVTSLPERCLSLTLNNAVEWADLRKAQREAASRSILAKAEAIIGWGSEADIKLTFGTSLVEIGNASFRRI